MIATIPSKTAYNAFAPYTRAAGIPLVDEEPVRHEDCLYYEVAGTDLWLVQSVRTLKFYVANSNGVRMSDDYWNPAYAVERFKELRDLEDRGWLYV